MPRIAILSLPLAIPALAFVFADDKNNAQERSAASEQRVFELRTYYTNPGKLDDLHRRFRDHTIRIFQKHGIQVVGFWTPQDEKDGKADTLIYLLAYPNREAAKKSWDAFRDDPEWQKARAESEKDGVLVKKVDSVYLD
jgi:NIPSNAP protein